MAAATLSAGSPPDKAAAASGAPDHAKDEAAIRGVVKQYVDARERRDPQAVAKLFTPDADQLVSSGEWRKGLDEVVKGTLASSQATGGHRTIDLESIRFVGREAAIADGRYVLTGLAQGQTRRMWTSFVLVRSEEGWRIAAIRNMLPAAAWEIRSPPKSPVPTK
jgi:uncharacterized protein (TIGR02246 family)